MRIDRIEQDGKPRRRFFLLVEVTFADEGDGNYYGDDELPDRFADWARSAIYDRDDLPRARFMALPEVLDADVQSVARGDYPGHEEERF